MFLRKNNMKVSIIGHGFVGKALENGLNDDIKVSIIDPIYKNEISELAIFKPEYIFICVPTPMNLEGDQDLTILNEVINDLNKLKTDSEIILKSTILPNHINKIQKSIPGLIYNPEFLTEKNAYEDFINGDLILLGSNINNLDKISDFYINHTKCQTKNIIQTDLASASLIKYTINSFLASKVMFFNEINSLFKKIDTSENWENFINAVSLDSRIGKSHMQVPGPDGRFGFGGACFPKDTKALYRYSIAKNSPLEILKKIIDLNDNIRSSYESVTDRENDQNINFLTKD